MDYVIEFLLIAAVAAIVFRIVIVDARRKRVERAYDFNPEKTQAAAEFASDSALKAGGYFGSRGFRLGRTLSGKKINYCGPGHMTVIAAARAGKLFTLLATLIMTLPKRYSLLIVDPKGEITCIVGKSRRKHGPVYAWNPYKIWLDHMEGVRQVRINPMADIDPHSPTVEADCAKLVTTFWDEKAANDDPHWGPSGKALFAGIVQALVKCGKPHERNLPTARNVLTGATGRSVFQFARWVMTLRDVYLRQTFSRYAEEGAEESRELNSIISTAMTQTDFLSKRAIAESLMAGDVSLRDVKRVPGMTLSLCLPLNRMDEPKPFALLSGWTLHCALEEGQRGARVPCVAVIDEMSQINYSKAWQDAFGLAAGAAGLQIVAVYQDVSQIMKQFGDAWQTVLQNSGVIALFGARDQATMDMASKMAGVTQVLSANRSVSIDHRTGEPHVTNSASPVVRPVIHPHEVRALPRDQMLLFCEGVPGVVKARRKPYTKECSGYGRNPYFRKAGWFSR